MATAISHSRVEGYLMCRRKDWYGYQFPTDEGRGIRRQTTSDSLSMGTAFHSIAASYYQALMDGGDLEEAQTLAWETYSGIMEGFEDRGGNYATLEEVVHRWIDNEEIGPNYEVLGVEMEFSLATEDGEFPFVVDCLIRDPKTGLIYVVDHKTAYYLYDDEKTDLMPQIPKYIGALRALGYNIAAGKYQVVRTQKVGGEKMLKSELIDVLSVKLGEPAGEVVDTWHGKPLAKWTVAELQQCAEEHGIEYVKPVPKERVYQFLDLEPSLQRVLQTMEEQFAVANELRDRDDLEGDEAERRAWRTANDTVCKHCSFRLICNEELRGGNSKLVLLHEYEPKPKRDAIALSEEVDDDVV